MQASIHDYMRVGLIQFMAYPATASGEGPILETLRKILVDDFFDAVEITWIKDPEARAEARQMIQTAHVTTAYGCYPALLSTGLNVNDLDEDGRRRAVDAVKAGIDEAIEMNAVGIGFLSGHYEDDRIEEALDALVRSTGELCDYARSKGDLRIVHENFDHGIDKKSLIGPAALARRYAQAVAKDHNNFGLLVDLSHIPLIGESPEEAIEPILPWLVHAHMGNCVMGDPALPGYGDLHPRFGFPDSENDVPELAHYLQVLKDFGFLSTRERPIVSFEIKPMPDEDPDLVIANAKRTLRAAWTQVK